MKCKMRHQRTQAANPEGLDYETFEEVFADLPTVLLRNDLNNKNHRFRKDQINECNRIVSLGQTLGFQKK